MFYSLKSRLFQSLLSMACLSFGLASCGSKTKKKATETPQPKPNVIFVMVDDLGYGDLGSYGQKEIHTPNLDRLAANGLRFTQCYSGTTVCAPSRSVLMTGQHTGHTTVRGNFGFGGVKGLAGGDGRVPLHDEDITIAEVLKTAGYVTGMTGKWGLGEPGTEGEPNDQGFDEWFGFLNQRRAHHHFTDYLWLNKEKQEIKEEDRHKPENYTHNLFTDFALSFVEKHGSKDKPFFLYIPYLLPHDEYEIPQIDERYKDKDWTEQEKIYASMVSLIDSDMGKIAKKLKDMGIDDNTLLFFTSDNGGARRWDGRFDSNGALRGKKRDLYEGGIRIPMIVSMPGTVSAGVVEATPWTFADVLPTVADFAGAKTPANIDGISVKDLLTGKGKPGADRAFYWEFHEKGGKQAVRKGNWKAVRLDVDKKGFHSDVELYDLSKDLGEKTNVATDHPEVVKDLLDVMEKEHTLSQHFPFPHEMEKLEKKLAGGK
ncbi:N-acetylgalactosamine-6-sulfatase [Fulvitalea axinellae]|uniref:N-acetylgalactosamine-6-sulfatase n=1 Tax=Fulvitalea axinellae TaxID=1182444 RepID=A0AAU9CMW2_9BACT|nr:N-acetylgalactosamine-6-sulfatase [Fulvitalea axinellae]